MLSAITTKSLIFISQQSLLRPGLAPDIKYKTVFNQECPGTERLNIDTWGLGFVFKVSNWKLHFCIQNFLRHRQNPSRGSLMAGFLAALYRYSSLLTLAYQCNFGGSLVLIMVQVQSNLALPQTKATMAHGISVELILLP